MRVPGNVDACIYVISAHSRASSRRTNGISQSFEHPLKPGLKGLPVHSSRSSRGIPLVLRHACAEQPRLSTFELAAVAPFGETRLDLRWAVAMWINYCGDQY